MRKTILIIDDDDCFARLITKVFGETFTVLYAGAGALGIQRAVEDKPDVIVLDIDMPGMNGHDVCRALKSREATHDIPVIFASGHSELEVRLTSYEVGGEAYLPKPVVPEVLARKIAEVLRNRKRNSELAEQAEYAEQIAERARSEAREAHLIMTFMREIAGQTSYVQMAQSCLAFLADYGLQGSVQLRAKNGCVSRNNKGFCSPLEESVLATMKTCGEIVDFGRRSAFNHERVSIIINNMPRENDEEHLRIRDTVMIVTEALDISLRSLELTFDAIYRGDTLLSLVHKNAAILREIQAHNQEQRGRSAAILNQLVNDIEDSFIFLGLSESQEEYLQNLARDAVDKAQALYNDAIEKDAIMRFDAVMRALANGLEDTLRQEIQGAADAAAEVENRIELF